MLALRIIRQAFSMVFGNLANAAKVSVGPLSIAFVLVIVFVMLSQSLISSGSSLGAFGILVSALFFGFVLAWIAVAWHRFILLEEYPGKLPRLKGLPIWSYIGLSVVLSLLMICVMFPLDLALSAITRALSGLGDTVLSISTDFLLGTIGSYIWFRIAIVLPAHAINKRLSITEAWRQTAQASRTILGAAALLAGLNTLLRAIFFTLYSNDPFVQIGQQLLQLVVIWGTIMVGLSMLTTLYGHLIEKRPLIE